MTDILNMCCIEKICNSLWQCLSEGIQGNEGWRRGTMEWRWGACSNCLLSRSAIREWWYICYLGDKETFVSKKQKIYTMTWSCKKGKITEFIAAQITNNLRANDRDPVRRVDLFSDFNFCNGYYSYIFYFKILNHSYYAFRGQSVFLWYTIMIFYRFVDGCGYHLLCSLSYQLLQINKLCWQFRVLLFLSVPEWASIG